jgi:F-type H+-transporting ATPase subunit gamma
VGRKGQDFLARRGRHLLGTFTGIIDRVRYDDVIPIARVIIDSFVSGQIDRAVLVYPRFVSTLTQRPDVVQLLPIEPPEAAQNPPPRRLDYIFEPDPQSILEQLLPRYIEVLVYQAILETAASFFSAQMVAMRNATDNANDIVDSLSLTYNKVRQANITREVTEIASAAEAMAAAARR